MEDRLEQAVEAPRQHFCYSYIFQLWAGDQYVSQAFSKKQKARFAGKRILGLERARAMEVGLL